MNDADTEVPLQYRRQRRCPFDPAPELHDLRDTQPVARHTAPNGDPVWLVTRHADVSRVLRDARFSNAATPATLTRPAVATAGGEIATVRQPGSLFNTDPPQHTRLRRMISGGFGAKSLARLTPRVEQIIARCLTRMEESGPPADLMREFALPVPSDVVGELLGLPPDLRAELSSRVAKVFDLSLSQQELVENSAAIRDLVAELVCRQRERPDEAVIGALVREHGDELTDEELRGMVSVLLSAGLDTLAGMLGLGTLLLLRHPADYAAIRADPRLVDTAVEEMLRYLTVVPKGLMRSATEDLVLGEQPIRAGEFVMVSLLSADRDERGFEDPDSFDITRDARGHLAFGGGIHYCIGAPLARQVMRTAFPALARRFPALRLAVPFEQISFRHLASVYSVNALPVAW